MTLGERIKRRREELGMTLLQVANQVGVSEATVQRYESGEIKNPKQPRIRALARALSVDVNYLMDWEDEGGMSPLPHNLVGVRRKRIPLLGEIAAGAPILAEGEYDAYVSCDDAVRCDFALRISGDSMEPRIQDGDIVFIREQDDVDDGQIAAVLIDDSATLKHVYHIPGGVQLVSDNPRYRPMIFTSENSDSCRILGLAVAFQRNL